MRAFVVLLFIAIAVPCYAEDPLETLNTVEDTVNTMQRALKTRAEQRFAGPDAPGETLPLDDRLYFISEEGIGASGYVAVRPCTEEIALAQALSDAQSCVWQPDGSVALGNHFWKSRPALAGELRLGALVVARESEGEGGWVLARITGLSTLGNGHVEISAPFRAALKGLRIVE